MTLLRMRYQNPVQYTDKLEGPMKGKKVYDMALAGSNGSLYMNIHTEENPNGEIRGTSTIPP